MKIWTRIFLCFLLLVVSGFMYLVNWVVEDLRPRYLEAMEESLVDTANILAAAAGERMDANANLPVEPLRAIFDDAARRRLHIQIYDLLKQRVDLRVYIADTNGIVVFDSDGGRDEGLDYSQWNDVFLTLRGKYGARATRTDPGDPASSILYVAAPILVHGRLAGSLTVCKPTVSSNLFIAAAQRKITITATLAGIAVLLLALATSAWITLPIQRLTDYARAIRDGRRAPFPKLGRNEIGLMGRAMEDMRVALEGKEYVERYVQALTHELKGPLSAIQGAVELMNEDMPDERRAQFLANTRRETERMRNIVDRMLLLSSLEARRGRRENEILDLNALAREAANALDPAAVRRGVALRFDSAPVPAQVRGEAFLLRQAIANLIQNAIDFTPSGGNIRIGMTAAKDRVELNILDSGPGIPDYALDRIFERFYSLQRPDSGMKSSGLGLSIVREIAALHEGEVQVANHPSGGAIATLTLSLAG